MPKKSNIVRYTSDEIRAMVANGESRTDWVKFSEMTEEELEASILADPDDIHEPVDWTKAVKGIPPPKDHINIRLDHDVLEWFKSNGRGYQTLMNNVLRSYVEAQQQ
jgi:uncharacterized protein (DUF4415 family)